MNYQTTFLELEPKADPQPQAQNSVPPVETENAAAVRLKTCFKCGNQKPINDFYTHPKMGDGYSGKCKQCTRNDIKKNVAIKKQDTEWMKAERERCRIKQKKANELGKVKKRTPEQQKIYYDKYKVERQARGKAFNALKHGRIIRKKNCEHCGDQNDNLEMHHEDHSKPFEVVWLCTKCHGKTRRIDK